MQSPGALCDTGFCACVEVNINLCQEANGRLRPGFAERQFCVFDGCKVQFKGKIKMMIMGTFYLTRNTFCCNAEVQVVNKFRAAIATILAATAIFQLPRLISFLRVSARLGGDPNQSRSFSVYFDPTHDSALRISSDTS